MPGRKTRAQGQLESEIVGVLHRSAEPLGAAEIQEALPGKKPAYTTVLTSLERLVAKGRVRRMALSPRRVKFAPVRSEAEDASDSMLSALATVEDRRAALVKFVGNLDDVDSALLRAALAYDRTMTP